MDLRMAPFLACGVQGINGLGYDAKVTPEDIMMAFCHATSSKIYNSRTREYDKGTQLDLGYCHVVFSGAEPVYDKATGKDISSHPGGDRVARFAAWIVENKLGDVVEAVPGLNPLHPERKTERLRVWVWTLDHAAIKKWYIDNKDSVKESAS